MNRSTAYLIPSRDRMLCRTYLQPYRWNKSPPYRIRVTNVTCSDAPTLPTYISKVFAKHLHISLRLFIPSNNTRRLVHQTSSFGANPPSLTAQDLTQISHPSHPVLHTIIALTTQLSNPFPNLGSPCSSHCSADWLDCRISRIEILSSMCNA